ncbi:MAG TPA: arginine deiminase family protein [Thermoanaerobaculia bacterium]|nr:arginine deiminase family protein [Thermoanaerobaculia bacterium]
MIAITRGVARTIQQAQVTHVERQRIDYGVAAAQHRQYVDLLQALGCTVVELPADDAHPDCVFIEDTAIVFDDLAVITRPGAESRRGETAVVAEALRHHRPLVHIEAPATIDGGDVLVLDERVYVGLSTRTNEAALAQLRSLTRREVIGVTVHGALHLKTAVTRVSRDALLLRREWLDVAPFEGWTLLEAEEPNAMLVGDVVVYPSAFPETARMLRERGIDVRTVDASELAKAEGGVTCCALLLKTQGIERAHIDRRRAVDDHLGQQPSQRR